MNVLYNTGEGRLRAAWRLLIQFILFRSLLTLAVLESAGLLVLALILALVGQFPWQTLGDGGALSQALSEAVASFPLLLAFPPLLALGVILLFYRLLARWLDRRPWQDYGFHFSRRWWRDFFFGFALGAGLISVVVGVEIALGWLSVGGTLENIRADVPFWPALLLAFLHYMVVAVSEELFARGYLLQNLAEGLNHRRLGLRGSLLLAYLLSSLVFGILHAGNLHASWLSTLNLVAGGLLFGLGFVLTGELAVPIGLHLAWNFFQGNVFGLPVSGGASEVTLLAVTQSGPEVWTGGAFGVEGGLLGLLAMLLGLVLLYGWVRWKYQRARPKVQLAVFAGERPVRDGKAAHVPVPG